MKTSLLFDFIVDKPSKTVFVNREFDAPLPLVWDAFTKQEILDQWWAPKPFMSKTKTMDFRTGGKRFYAMVSPDGMESWQLQKYTSVTPKSNFKMTAAFSDKDEHVDPKWPGSDWNFDFSEKDGITTVKIAIVNESLERMEKMIEMGFKQGFTATLDYLASTLLPELK